MSWTPFVGPRVLGSRGTTRRYVIFKQASVSDLVFTDGQNFHIRGVSLEILRKYILGKKRSQGNTIKVWLLPRLM